jgi:hypothetical protein
MKEHHIEFDYSNNPQLDMIRKRKFQKHEIYLENAGTPEKYFNTLLKEVDGRKYLLTSVQKLRILNHLAKDKKVVFSENSEDIHKGETVCILAPGPSLSKVDSKILQGQYCMVVNSAGFKYWGPKFYWVIAEARFQKFLNSKGRLSQIRNKFFEPARTMILTARALSWYYHGNESLIDEKKGMYKKIFLTDLEEKQVIPFPAEATTVINALGMAWWMGFKSAIIYGLDLSKEKGPYVKGSLYTEYGANATYKYQPFALKQIWFPDMDIYRVFGGTGDQIFNHISLEESYELL